MEFNNYLVFLETTFLPLIYPYVAENKKKFSIISNTTIYAIVKDNQGGFYV